MHRLSTALFLWFLLGAAGIAQADPSSAGPRPDPTATAGDDGNTTVRARALYNAGRAAYRQHNYEKAQVSFFEAFGLKKHWQIAGNLGDAEVRLQMYVDAAQHLAFAVRTGELDPIARGAAAHDLEHIRGGLEQAKKEVVTIEADIQPPGSQILLDGKIVGVSPLDDPMFIEPGHHRLEARGKDLVPASYEFDGARGSTYSIRLHLDPAPQPTATTLPSPAKTTLAAADFGQPSAAEVDVPPERTSNASRNIVIATEGTLALTAAVLGGVFSAKAASDSDRVAFLGQQAFAQTGPNGCATAPFASACSELRQATDDHNSAKSTATVAWASAGVLGLATVGTLLFWPSARPRDAQLRVVPSLSSRMGGFTVDARF